jgi:hypothetical protein
MNPEAINYIKSQIIRDKDRLHPYVRNGKWFFPKRHIYYRIVKYINDFLLGQTETRWVIIPGIRGVGKTTILAQLFFTYFKKVKNFHIIYISVDDIITAGLNLSDVLTAYESVLEKTFESQPNPVLLFIDEVQQDSQWASILKSLYDRARNVFVVCTGSSAVQLQTNPDVARRGIFEKLYPLSFSEYEMLKNNTFPTKGLKQEIKSAIYESNSADEVYKRLKLLEPQILTQWSKFKDSDIDGFLSTGTLPFTLLAEQMSIYDRIGLLIDRMINKDIQELGKFDIQTLSGIKRLLFIMADVGDGLSINSVGSIIGMDRNTLSAVLEALEKAEIIIRVIPHGSNSSIVRKPSKYLFMSPAIRMSLLSITGLDETFLVRRGKLLEDVAGLHFYREFVSTGAGSLAYDSAQAGADFILKIVNKKQIAIEIGIGDKNFAQVKNTMKKIKCDYGLVICTSASMVLSEKDNVVKIPLKYFLLM